LHSRHVSQLGTIPFCIWHSQSGHNHISVLERIANVSHHMRHRRHLVSHIATSHAHHQILNIVGHSCNTFQNHAWSTNTQDSLCPCAVLRHAREGCTYQCQKCVAQLAYLTVDQPGTQHLDCDAVRLLATELSPDRHVFSVSFPAKHS